MKSPSKEQVSDWAFIYRANITTLHYYMYALVGGLAVTELFGMVVDEHNTINLGIMLAVDQEIKRRA